MKKRPISLSALLVEPLDGPFRKPKSKHIDFLLEGFLEKIKKEQNTRNKFKGHGAISNIERFRESKKTPTD